jgi:outer membrane receptor protein involved in Fe transport
MITGITLVSRSVGRASLLISTTALTAVSFAATAADGDARSEGPLATVIVIGTTPLQGAEVDRSDIAAPVQTASARDIDRTHALDLTAFMNRTLGSVYVNDVQNNPLQPDISYRGYTASPLLGTPQGLSVYMDGVRLNQPFGDVVSWDLVPRAAISTMTLMPGSNPVFGLNTLGGALSLHTKDGFSDPGYAVELNYGSDSRRQITVEGGGHTGSGLYWYGTANKLKEDGWRDDSPTDASQVFAKVGWRSDVTDVALTGAYADTDLNGNGLQDLQFLSRDYDSVYTKPDNTQNKAYLLNLTGSQKLSDVVTLSGNVYYRNIKTRTFNGDVNDDSLGEALYQPSAGERAALTAAGYTGFPTSGETQVNTPFPKWRCIANILTNEEPNEKCNGLANSGSTRQHEAGFSVQATFASMLAGRQNHFTVGGGLTDSGATFSQSSQFGYLTPDRGIVTVNGPGAFADGSQDSQNAFDARVALHGDTKTRSVFFTDTWDVGPIVHLTLSGRYDRSEIENRDGLTPGGGPGSLDSNQTFDRFNPAVGVTITPSDALNFYLGYTEGSRAPSAIELGCADPENPCKLPNAMAGDPPLDQVVTRTIEAGMRGRVSDNLVWNAGVFRAENRDDIMFVADNTSGFGFFQNFGETRRQGVEAGVNGRFGAFDVGANYTFLDATYRSSEEVLGEGNSTNEEGPGFEGAIDVESDDRIPLIPRHIFKAFAGWHILPQLTLNADVITIAGSSSRGNENNEHEADGVFYLGPGRTGGYTVANLGLDYVPIPALTLFAQVNNLFDREYYSASQLGSTGFNAAGNFVARPFAGPIVDGERPITGSTFYAPGAPRSWWVGVRYSFGK